MVAAVQQGQLQSGRFLLVAFQAEAVSLQKPSTQLQSVAFGLTLQLLDRF